MTIPSTSNSLLRQSSKSPLRFSDEDNLIDGNDLNHNGDCTSSVKKLSLYCVKNDEFYYLSKKRRRLQSIVDLRKKSSSYNNFNGVNKNNNLLTQPITTATVSNVGFNSEESGAVSNDNETKQPLRKNGLFFSGNAQSSSGVNRLLFRYFFQFVFFSKYKFNSIKTAIGFSYFILVLHSIVLAIFFKFFYIFKTLN